jgi:hypothetical protein
MIGYYYNLLGEMSEVPDDSYMMTLSKSEEYIHLAINEDEEEGEDTSNAYISKFHIYTGNLMFFYPFKNVHLLILSANLPDLFTVNEEQYRKKDFIHYINQEDNDELLTDVEIMELLFNIGYAGFHSNDLGYHLYNVFTPKRYLKFHSSKKWQK